VTNEDLLLLSAARRHAKSGSGKAIRLAADLALAEVAEAVGADSPTVLRWERNETRPRGERAIKWATLLADLEAAGHAPTQDELSGKVA
jgi:transcriptional regulator with XRE-family HTH domain